MGKYVNLKFFGYLSDIVTGIPLDNIECGEADTVREILERINVSEKLVGFVSVNGSLVGIDYQVSNGDTIKIYPLVVGG